MRIKTVPTPTETTWPVCSSDWLVLKPLDERPPFRHMPYPEVCSECGGLTLAGYEIERDPKDVKWDREGNRVDHSLKSDR